jgi:hypothetical protein
LLRTAVFGRFVLCTVYTGRAITRGSEKGVPSAQTFRAAPEYRMSLVAGGHVAHEKKPVPPVFVHAYHMGPACPAYGCLATDASASLRRPNDGALATVASCYGRWVLQP